MYGLFINNHLLGIGPYKLCLQAEQELASHRILGQPIQVRITPWCWRWFETNVLLLALVDATWLLAQR